MRTSNLKNCVVLITALTMYVQSYWIATPSLTFIIEPLTFIRCSQLHETIQLKTIHYYGAKQKWVIYMAPAHMHGPADGMVHSLNTDPVITSYNLPTNPLTPRYIKVPIPR